MAGMDREPAHEIERLIFFSDAVIAIAITLLVIEIHVPRLPHGADNLRFAQALADLFPEFLGFLISFFVIGAFWAGHHRTMACARNWHERLVFPNLLFLFTIAAMPFFTAFSSANPNSHVPVAVYCGWLTLTALFNLYLQRMVLRAPVVDPHVGDAQVRMIYVRGFGVLAGALTAFVVALFTPVPATALWALITIPLWRIAIQRVFRTRH